MIPASSTDVTSAKADDSPAGALMEADAVLALHAEDLAITKRQVVRTVQVRRETRSRDTLVEEALTKTGVVIEHVAMGQFVDAVPPVREEGDTTILPIVEEVVVIERRLRLVEEVRIRRVQTSSMHVETVTLREQHAVVTRSDPVVQDAGPVPVTPAFVPPTLPVRQP